MKPLQIIKITILALAFSGCSIGIVESRSNNETNTETRIETKAENKTVVDANDAQTNKKTTAKSAAALTNAVCPDPAKPCKHRAKEFAEWEMPFKLPAKIAPNKTYSSAPFYAVLLKTFDSTEDCDGGEYMEAIEQERKELQDSQPARKAFAYYSCPNMDAVGYDFEGLWDKNREMMLISHFIAIYAGETKEEADALRKQMLADYPKATVKKMTANWERIEQ